MKMGRWLDITRPLYPGMPVWPGDHPVAEESTYRIGDGDTCNVSCWAFSSHTGTHVDPPLHFIAGGPSVDGMDLDTLCGPCQVLDLSAATGHVSAQALAAAEGAERVLLKTRNSFAPTDVFREDFAALQEDAAVWLVEHGVRLIGIDGPSIEPFHSQSYPVHHAILGAGIAVVEGLALARIAPGEYELVCAPLPWRGGDGAPCRALLRPM